MTCEEFRSRYQLWLDGRKSSPLPAESVLHSRLCCECGMYVRAMNQIDADLGNLPDVALPENFLAGSGEYWVQAHGGGGKLLSLLRSRISLALPPLVAWSISACLPLPWNFAVQFLLVSGAMALFALTSLRPRFVA